MQMRKERMSRSDQNQFVEDAEKVVPLFRRQEDHLPISSIDNEAFLLDSNEEFVDEKEDNLALQEAQVSRLVSEGHFPDQSMYILDEQLEQLKSSFNRLKFYLSELEDILPH
jgi:hypothetical protein